jgi:hypothetical protein
MYFTLSLQLSSIIAILLNLILFVLTLKFTPPALADYSRIIRLNCFFDAIIDLKLFFSMNVSVYEVNFYFRSNSRTKNSTYFQHPIVLNGYLYMMSFSPLWNYLPNVAKSFLYSCVYGIILLISIVPIDFYYRFSSVCR